MAKEESREIIENLKRDGCMDVKESERCPYHRGDKYSTDLVRQHYEIAYPEGEKS